MQGLPVRKGLLFVVDFILNLLMCDAAIEVPKLGSVFFWFGPWYVVFEILDTVLRSNVLVFGDVLLWGVKVQE